MAPGRRACARARTAVARARVPALVSDPAPQNSTEMRDGSGRRLRVGGYRVLYRLDGDELTIHAVGHRKDVYS